MKTFTIVIIAIVVAFFITGMITGNYHCGSHFCNTVTELVNFVTDVVKTEAKGITFVVNGISSIVG